MEFRCGEAVPHHHEVISVAPMLDCTDRHFRYFLRGITKCTTLYTEMIVDTTLMHQRANLEYFIGNDVIDGGPTVMQLGGHNAEELKVATELVSTFGGYSEINLNCGCPSPRVSKRCFGARLMLEPDHVRELVYSMGRATDLPITVKCRIGADDLDKYEDLTRFIATVGSGGVKKFIIHSRKCFLNGLTPKQNREIPPLQYDAVHRLVKEFPDLTFVLNGGITTLQDTDAHLFAPFESGLPPAHGVMIGRAAYSDPFILSQVDSLFYNTKDPCLTRREVMDRYLAYCDRMQSPEGPVKSFKGKVSPISPSFLIRAVHNAFVGCDGCSKYKTALNDVYDKLRKEDSFPTARFVIEEAMKEVAEEDLDFPVGNHSFDPNEPLYFGSKAREDAVYKADHRRRIHHLRFDAAQSQTCTDPTCSSTDPTCSSAERVSRGVSEGCDGPSVGENNESLLRDMEAVKL